MRLLATILLTLFTFHNIVAYQCSFEITQRYGTLQTYNSGCSSVIYYFQRATTSYWYLTFTLFNAGTDNFSFFDGPDIYSPTIAEYNATNLNTESPYVSTFNNFTMRISQAEQGNITASYWELQYFNYEEIVSVVNPIGEVWSGNDGFVFQVNQTVQGKQEDYVGSTWIIAPDTHSNYVSYGMTLSVSVDNVTDTSGTLTIILHYGGFMQFYHANDTGKSMQWSFYPSSDYESQIIIHSAVATQNGSSSNFSVRVQTDQWKESASKAKEGITTWIIVVVVVGAVCLVAAGVAIFYCAKNVTIIYYSAQIDKSQTSEEASVL